MVPLSQTGAQMTPLPHGSLYVVMDRAATAHVKIVILKMVDGNYKMILIVIVAMVLYILAAIQCGNFVVKDRVIKNVVLVNVFPAIIFNAIISVFRRLNVVMER